MRLRHHRIRLPLLVLAVSALVLAACGDDGDGDNGDAAGGPDDVGTIEFGLIPWDEAIAVTNLWEYLLEEEGYDVEQTQLEVGAIFQGLAQDELDLFVDAWLPATHQDYWEEYGEDIDEVGVWFEEAPLTWTVPSYMEDINSIADLQGNADTFGGEIIGIESGAGLTRVSLEEVIPTYELGDDYTLVEGSTPAMLSELEQSIANEEPIVVTLWHPHWAYGEWDLKDLEDPEGALGEPDEIRIVSRSGFGDEATQVTDWLSNFSMSLEELSELEVMINEGNDPLEAAGEWAEQNSDRVDEWMGS